MAVLQVNPPGMQSTDPGYISSITIRTGGSATVLTPNATTGQVTTDAPSISAIVNNINNNQCMKLITG